MAASFAGLTPYNFGFNTCPPGRRDPTLLSDPNGECPVCIGALIGLVSGYFSGKAAGLKGGELIGFMFGNGLIGALSGGIGSAIGTGLISSGVNSIVAGGIAGASAGAVAGFYGTALAGGNPLDGLWKGALTGLIGGGVGSSLTGAGGAIAGGASAGATGAALNGGDIGQVGMGALAGGAIAGGLYMGTSLIKFFMLAKKVPGLTFKRYRMAARGYQLTQLEDVEYGNLDDPKLGNTGLVKGQYKRTRSVIRRFNNMHKKYGYFRKRNGRFVKWTIREGEYVDYGPIEKGYEWSFHTHTRYGSLRPSVADLGFNKTYIKNNGISLLVSKTAVYMTIGGIENYIGPAHSYFNMSSFFLFY